MFGSERERKIWRGTFSKGEENFLIEEENFPMFEGNFATLIIFANVFIWWILYRYCMDNHNPFIKNHYGLNRTVWLMYIVGIKFVEIVEFPCESYIKVSNHLHKAIKMFMLIYSGSTTLMDVKFLS